MQRILHTPVCATCRLRTLIKAKEIARARKAIITPSIRPFATKPSPPSRTFATARGRINSKISGVSQERPADFVEGLYSSGAITREEWRESVWIQSGLKRDVNGDIVEEGGDELGIEDQVRRIHAWYSGEIVPRQLLEGEEVTVYQRLFGELRQVEVDEEGISEEDAGGAGTGVLIEAHDGELEEVEFDEELETEEHYDPPISVRKMPANLRLAEDIRAAFEGEQLDEPAKDTANALDEAEEEEDREYQRVHPLTRANRFTTSPSTLEIPKLSFIEPVTSALSGYSNTHLSEAAHRIFGGPGLPYSTATPNRGKTMQQKPIALDAYQGSMAELDGAVYMSTIMPGVYSSVMSVLTETRKRMGTAWAENLVRKAEAGDLRILDAGGAGAGILAVREMLRAEWERMHEDDHDSPTALAEVDGKVGAANLSAPTGKATVLIGSSSLQRKISKLLDNTTFIPRLPDYIHAQDQEATKQGKFDLIIAPHMLWPLREDHLRKAHVQNLFSLLSINGGILLLLEKGVARGFELIAAAREQLLSTRIATPDSPNHELRIDEPTTNPESPPSHQPKEPALIIAPCTNHTSCPMYAQKGLIKGRRDICAFSQRYHRPAFLQNIYGTKGRNHEDVEFSYLSLHRGPLSHPTPHQNASTTNLAFAGYEHAPAPPDSLTLPRNVLPPLKRHGHVILDLCTPSGTLERWTVPRSFSRTAYRDAKKASWGDLWALGAKTRVPRIPKIKKHANNREEKGKGKGKEQVLGFGSDEYGRVVFDGERVGRRRVDFEGGRVRGGERKVKGIRDKRDKKAGGNGRVKRGEAGE